MKKIHQLSPLLISKIAAGEVIERPSYAIKELIENAIDAKATEIKIYIEEAGLHKIQVADNGEGMSQEDVLESYKPHTTSKIKEEDELHVIQSLGFRGEALASLGAVSRLTVKSRLNTTLTPTLSQKARENREIGFEIVVENGKLLRSSPIGMAPGTVVIAENLFAHIPARKKFLKSSQTELRHIIDTVNHFAVVYPKIRFVLQHNKRILLDYPASDDISERVEQLVGQDVFSFFLPVKKSESYLTLSGFIAKPQMNATTQSKQFLFVNKRKISDKLIAQAVKESFGSMLESTTYPLFVLFISVPFEMVDVNVHPRKEQVSFVNNQFIFQTIKNLVAEVLQENNLTFQNLSWKRTGVGQTGSFAGKLLKEQVLDKESLTIDEKTNMFQMNKLYIVLTTKSGLVLVDQHAAHERILFEKLKKEFLSLKNKHVLFQLPEPISLYLTKSEEVLLKENKKMLSDLGFQFVISAKAEIQNKNGSQIKSRMTGNDAIVLTHLPTLFQDRNPQTLIKNILERLADEKGLLSIDTVSEEMLAFLACRAAVKAGDVLTEDQMKKILKDLENTPNNITCPHGRPTRLMYSLKEIDTQFGR